jgi:anti-anti-sigma factor
MLEDIYPVQWAGQQAVLELPEHIDESNAKQIQDELLSAVNHGVKALIADMTATISCDHAGADAVVCAFQQAVISGTELRLVVTAQIVRRVLSLSGVDRLVSIYPSLETATAAAGVPAAVLTQRRPAKRGDNWGRTGTDGHLIRDLTGAQQLQDLASLARAAVTAEHERRSRELLDTVITRLFHVALSLQATTDLPAEVTRQRIAEALGHLDDTIREIRDTAFTTRGRNPPPLNDAG